jgi:hypothetical protein
VGLTCLDASQPGTIRQGLVSSGYRKEKADAWAARRVGWKRENPGP